MERLLSPAAAATVVVGAAASGGAYALVEVCLPAGAAIPLHVATREELLVHVLGGAVDVRLDRDSRRLAAGGHLLIPRDVARALAAVRETRLLVLAVPAGIERLAATLGDGALAPDDLAALLAAAGIDLLRRPAAG